MGDPLERCQCKEPACNVAHGASGCESTEDTTIYRTSEPDAVGMKVCVHCAQDAVESGLFRCDTVPRKYNRRAERSRADHVTRLRVVVEAADKLAEACAKLDLTEQMYRLEEYFNARREYRLDRGITDNMSEQEGGPA